MTALQFTIPGPPRGKGRPRFFRRGKGVGTYTDDKTAAYENLVALAAYAAHKGPKLEGPLQMSVTAVLPKPKSAKRSHPTVKPDLDNIVKAILDGCNRAGIWGDDAQVVSIAASKSYGEPCCVVLIGEAVNG